MREAAFHALEDLDIFAHEKLAAELLEGESRGLTARDAERAGGVFAYLVRMALEWRRAGTRGLLVEGPPPPLGATAVLSKLMPSFRVVEQGFLRRVWSQVRTMRALHRRYDLIVGEVPGVLFDEHVGAKLGLDRWGHPAVSFLHRCRSLLRSGGSALILIPAGLARLPAYQVPACIDDGGPERMRVIEADDDFSLWICEAG